jgi:hypothetical protein
VATAIGTYATTALVALRLGITASAPEAVEIGKLCDSVNQYIEGPEGAGRVLAPISSATYLFDGDGTNVLRHPPGIRAVSLLEVAPSTGAAFTTLVAGDYFLRPLSQNREPGWPAFKIVLSDVPAGGYRTFPRGMANIRPTMTGGWAAMPDDVIELAVTTVVRAWHARMAGQADIIGTDEYGNPIVSKYISKKDQGTLYGYRRAWGLFG